MNRFRSAFRRHNNNGGIVPVLAATVVGSSSLAAAAWWYSFEEETTTGAVVRRVRVPLSVSNDSDSTTVHGPTTGTGTDNNNNNNNDSGTFGLPSTMTTTTTTRCFAATTTTTERTKANNKNHNNSSTSSNSSSEDRPRLIFLGTGSSTGCPKPTCAMRFHQQQRRNTNNNNNNNNNNSSIATTTAAKNPRPDPEACQTSFRALAGGDPKTNPDYRNNPSLLIHHYDESSQSYKNIVIDAGKTFREAALRWFPIHGIESLDAIVLTHHHMDAAAGLDDVRGFQQKRKVAAKNDNDKEKQQQQQYVTDPMPLYLSEFCHRNLQLQFPWLLPPEPDESNNNNNNSSSSSNSKGKKEASSSPPSSSTMMMPVQAEGRPVVTRNVASFDATIFRDYRAETPVGGFPIVPLPIWHGADLISHGFAFSLVPGPSRTKTNNTNTKRPRPLNVVYLSDISEMVPETLEYIREKLPPTDILVVDALLWGKNHPVHYGLEQAVETAATIRPRMGTYLVGMSCDSFLPHEAMNAYLRAKYGTDTDTETSGGSPIIALAHDGLVIDLPD